MPDYTVRLWDLPPAVHGMLLMDEQDHANIYLNVHDSLERQRRALRHELAHLRRGDPYSPLPVSILEANI